MIDKEMVFQKLHQRYRPVWDAAVPWDAAQAIPNARMSPARRGYDQGALEQLSTYEAFSLQWVSTGYDSPVVPVDRSIAQGLLNGCSFSYFLIDSRSASVTLKLTDFDLLAIEEPSVRRGLITKRLQARGRFDPELGRLLELEGTGQQEYLEALVPILCSSTGIEHLAAVYLLHQRCSIFLPGYLQLEYYLHVRSWILSQVSLQRFLPYHADLYHIVLCTLGKEVAASLFTSIATELELDNPFLELNDSCRLLCYIRTLESQMRKEDHFGYSEQTLFIASMPREYRAAYFSHRALSAEISVAQAITATESYEPPSSERTATPKHLRRYPIGYALQAFKTIEKSAVLLLISSLIIWFTPRSMQSTSLIGASVTIVVLQSLLSYTVFRKEVVLGRKKKRRFMLFVSSGVFAVAVIMASLFLPV